MRQLVAKTGQVEICLWSQYLRDLQASGGGRPGPGYDGGGVATMQVLRRSTVE